MRYLSRLYMKLVLYPGLTEIVEDAVEALLLDGFNGNFLEELCGRLL